MRTRPTTVLHSCLSRSSLFRTRRKKLAWNDSRFWYSGTPMKDVVEFWILLICLFQKVEWKTGSDIYILLILKWHKTYLKFHCGREKRLVITEEDLDHISYYQGRNSFFRQRRSLHFLSFLYILSPFTLPVLWVNSYKVFKQ